MSETREDIRARCTLAQLCARRGELEDLGGVVLYRPAMDPGRVERWRVTGGRGEGRSLVFEATATEHAP